MKILDVMWFSGRSHVGVVRVEDEWDGIKYYVGAPPFVMSEDEDKEWIASWGSSFPKSVGDHLFGVDLGVGEK